MHYTTLSEANAGASYIVMEIKDESRLKNRLSSMGILRGCRLEVCQNLSKQPVLIFTRDTLIAIGRKESKKIMIGGLEHE